MQIQCRQCNLEGGAVGVRVPYGSPYVTVLDPAPGWSSPRSFRIVHLGQAGHSGAPVAAYREQMVEIALGPKGAFENGNIGTLRRRAPPGQELSTVLPVRGDPKPPPEPKTPRVVELLRKAIEWKALIESGKIATQAEIARQEGITRARVTQVWVCCGLRRRFRSTFCPCPLWFRDPRFQSGRFDLLNPSQIAAIS